MFKTIHNKSIVVASACLVAAIAGGLAVPTGDGVPGTSEGTVVAMVRHVVTNVPLADMPVFVNSAGKGGGGEWDCRLGGVTNKLGMVEIGPLGDGVYQAIVFYNDIKSEPAMFKIYGSSTANVTIFFNPDIDKR